MQHVVFMTKKRTLCQHLHKCIFGNNQVMNEWSLVLSKSVFKYSHLLCISYSKFIQHYSPITCVIYFQRICDNMARVNFKIPYNRLGPRRWTPLSTKTWPHFIWGIPLGKSVAQRQAYKFNIISESVDDSACTVHDQD